MFLESGKRRAAGLIAISLCVLCGLAREAGAADEASPPEFGVSLEEAWIPMPDGVRLAADLYVPTGAANGEKFPVLLEYLPYRKTESRGSTFRLFSYFVERGYIVARVDIRGTGGSEGHLIPYEYSDREQEDGEAVIAWLAGEPRSNGNVGMFGISWGGFNALQMAARNPPALKTIIAVDATGDLYQDDVHYMDGIMHVDSWEMSQDLYNALPAAPDYVIDEDYFKNRFDTAPWMLTYKNQQRDGPFWYRASLARHYERLKIPTFLIGGWYDGYRDSLPRILEHVDAPVKAMIGPWSHAWPNEPYPEPGMEWRHEAVRWFDHWLKGRNTGIMDEPAFAVYVREWHPPGPHLDDAPGFWRWEDGWPIDRIEQRSLYPQPNHSLAANAPEAVVQHLRYVPASGVEAGGPVMWWGDVAPDQRPTDAFSLVYDTAPVGEDTEILGLPKAMLKVAADAPQANWYVRLSDVAPDGTVTLVTGAGFNGNQRNSAANPEAIVPGQAFPLAIDMHFTSWIFPQGHRIRLSISNAQWPMLWPTPYPMTTDLYLGGEGGSVLLLPVVPAGSDRPAPQFQPPQESPSYPGFESIDLGETSSGYGEISSVDRNPQTGEATVVATNSGGTRFPWGTQTHHERIEHRTSNGHPEKTSIVGTYSIEMDQGKRVLLWEGKASFTSDKENFYYNYTRRLSENGKQIREKTWKDTIPRDHQ